MARSFGSGGGGHIRRDVTGVSTWSRNTEEVESCHDLDHERLPQESLSLDSSEDTHRPACIDINDGSAEDYVRAVRMTGTNEIEGWVATGKGHGGHCHGPISRGGHRGRAGRMSDGGAGAPGLIGAGVGSRWPAWASRYVGAACELGGRRVSWESPAVPHEVVPILECRTHSWVIMGVTGSCRNRWGRAALMDAVVQSWRGQS